MPALTFRARVDLAAGCTPTVICPATRRSRVTTTEPRPTVMDEAKLNAFIGKAVDDWGTLTSAALIVIGDKLGLYTALAEAGPATPNELAHRTGTVERYVRPWLVNQAAGGYVDYDPSSGRFRLPPEHAAALAAVPGAYQLVTAAMRAEPRITESIQDRRGHALGRARRRVVRRDGALLPTRLRAKSRPALDPGLWTASRPSFRPAPR